MRAVSAEASDPAPTCTRVLTRRRDLVAARIGIEVAVANRRQVELAGDLRREHPIEFLRAGDSARRRVDSNALVAFHQRRPRDADRRARKQLHVSGAR